MGVIDRIRGWRSGISRRSASPPVKVEEKCDSLAARLTRKSRAQRCRQLFISCIGLRSSSYDRNEEFEENCQQISWISIDSSADPKVCQDSHDSLNRLTNQVLDLPEDDFCLAESGNDDRTYHQFVTVRSDVHSSFLRRFSSLYSDADDLSSSSSIDDSACSLTSSLLEVTQLSFNVSDDDDDDESISDVSCAQCIS